MIPPPHRSGGVGEVGRVAIVPGTRLVDYLLPRPVVIDKARAGDGDPCRCLDGTCFKHGVLGAIGGKLLEELCRTQEPFDPAHQTRVRLFLEAEAACPADDLEARLECLCREMKERGLNVC